MKNRYQPQHLRSGAVVQSGLGLRPRGEPPSQAALEAPFRAVVVNTYVRNHQNNVGVQSIECDVVAVAKPGLIPRVPVMQRGHGKDYAHSLWVPRPSKTADTAGLQLVADPPGSFPKFNEFDGDLVLVDYIEGDAGKPLIVGALTHERTNLPIRSSRQGPDNGEQNAADPDPNTAFAQAAGGWNEADGGASRGVPYEEEWYSCHGGSELRYNRRGDVLIDTMAAQGGGRIRLRGRSDRTIVIGMGSTDIIKIFFDGVRYRIDLGENANERVILGDTFTPIYVNHTHPDSMGGTGIPIPNASITAGDHLSDSTRVKKG